MSNLTYLAGCAGVTLAVVMLAHALLHGPSHSRSELLLPAATLLLLAWSLGLGPDGSLLIDFIRTVSSAWVIHASTHNVDGGHHA